jgi:hypothetical protein
MAARFRSDGGTEYGMHADAAQFKRVVSPSYKATAQDKLSLVDMVAGGDGFGAHLAGAIDPLTGQRDYEESPSNVKHKGPDKKGRTLFHTTSWHPTIDSVFIPSRTGRDVQIDSIGHKVDLPANTGRTWGPIWARNNDSLVASDASDFWGDSVLANRENGALKELIGRLKQSNSGLVGIHANVGMTFDLQSVRLLHRRLPLEFTGTVANIENSREMPPVKQIDPRLASFHVYVDGELRYQRLNFGLDDGNEAFSAALTPTDRFLTIISTDGGGSDYFDHVVLIDPVIGLAKEE